MATAGPCLSEAAAPISGLPCAPATETGAATTASLLPIGSADDILRAEEGALPLS